MIVFSKLLNILPTNPYTLDLSLQPCVKHHPDPHHVVGVNKVFLHMADCLAVDEDVQELVLDGDGARTSMELLEHEEFDVLHALVSAA